MLEHRSVGLVQDPRLPPVLSETVADSDEDPQLKKLRDEHRQTIERVEQAKARAEGALVGSPERRALTTAEEAETEAGRRMAARVEQLSGVFRCPEGHVLVNWTGGPCRDATGRTQTYVMYCRECDAPYALQSDGSQIPVWEQDSDWE